MSGPSLPIIGTRARLIATLGFETRGMLNNGQWNLHSGGESQLTVTLVAEDGRSYTAYADLAQLQDSAP
jgi:hypothetical protein